MFVPELYFYCDFLFTSFFPPSGFIYLIRANLNIHVFADATLLSNTNMRNADVGWPKNRFSANENARLIGQRDGG